MVVCQRAFGSIVAFICATRKDVWGIEMAKLSCRLLLSLDKDFEQYALAQHTRIVSRPPVVVDLISKIKLRMHLESLRCNVVHLISQIWIETILRLWKIVLASSRAGSRNLSASRHDWGRQSIGFFPPSAEKHCCSQLVGLDTDLG